MKVSKITHDNDWSFGHGFGDYIYDSNRIAQCVKTRCQSFQNDNWLSLEKHIDWLSLLGNKKTEKIIHRQIYKTIMSVDGVVRVDNILISVNNRIAAIEIFYTDIFNREISINFEVSEHGKH